jgi:hypothetical protein
MGCELEANAASFGMNVFKYSMNLIRTRLILEWQALDIAYPLWLTHVVMDELYYTATLVATCVVCFAVGLAIGIVWTLV